MSYIVVITPRTEQKIAAQPESLRHFIAASLQILARSPVSRWRASAATTRGQTAEFEFRQQGVSVWVTVTFLYGQDEQTLHIENIVVEFGE